MVTTKAELLILLREHESELKALGVRRCGLFGSFRHERASASSDVDVLVEFEPDQKNFVNFSHLVFLLEDLFQRPVEVLTVEGLSPHIGPRILSEVEYVAVGA